MNMPYGFPGMPMVQPPFGAFNKLAMAPPLYIGDLDENIHEETLHDFFSKYGPLHFVRIMRDPANGKSRGFAFVNFLYPRDAESARQFAQYEKIGRKHIRIMFKRNVRDFLPDANLFVKNLDPSVNVKYLHNHFTQSGINVLSAKVATNSEGQSLGYGYVQFEKKEDAENCLKILQGSKLKENEIQLLPFVAKEKRPGNVAKKNIYVKNLPLNKSEEEIEQIVHDLFSRYGEIENKFIKRTGDRYSAFVSFRDEQGAQEAVQALTDNPETLDGAEGPIYVSWHQGRAERNRELSKQHQQTQNETNLYVKNLRLDVTPNDLKKAFQQYGTIVSVDCKDWASNDAQKKARFGFIAFADSNDAQKAVQAALNDPEIKSLYLADAKPYINLHQARPKRNEFLYNRKKLRSQQAAMGGMGGMGGMGMPGMPPMGGMPPMAGMGQPGFGGMGMQNRKFPPLPGAMNPGAFGRPGGALKQGPKKHLQGWNKGPGQRPPMQMQQQRPGGPGGPGAGGPGVGGPGVPRQQQQQQMRGAPVDQGKKMGMNLKPQIQQTQPQTQGGMTVAGLRNKLNDFLQLEEDKQRQILGELLFPLVRQLSSDNLAPKITGMLIDLSVLEVTEILEFLENPSLLEERVSEAVELIESEGL